MHMGKIPYFLCRAGGEKYVDAGVRRWPGAGAAREPLAVLGKDRRG
jgi:hypothetical protein